MKIIKNYDSFLLRTTHLFLTLLSPLSNYALSLCSFFLSRFLGGLESKYQNKGISHTGLCELFDGHLDEQQRSRLSRCQMRE